MEKVEVDHSGFHEEIEELFNYTDQMVGGCPLKQLALVQHLLIWLEEYHQAHIDRHEVRRVRKNMRKAIKKAKKDFGLRR